MNSNTLLCFREVARELSFRRAAENLHYSQPTVTGHIKRLEEDLGVRLLERGGRQSVMLTTNGRAFLPHAERILDLMATARTAAHAAHSTPGRHRPLPVGPLPVASRSVGARAQAGVGAGR